MDSPRPGARRRLIVNTDAKNEADDQFAIAHALLTPMFDVRGIIPTHFGLEKSATSMQDSREEVDLILRLMSMENEVTVVNGAEHALPDEFTPVDSEGARLIIEESMSDESTLYLAFLGPLTDMASALLLYPELRHRDIVVVWVGGAPYGERAPAYWPEFNLRNDVSPGGVVPPVPSRVRHPGEERRSGSSALRRGVRDESRDGWRVHHCHEAGRRASGAHRRASGVAVFHTARSAARRWSLRHDRRRQGGWIR